MTSPFLGDSNLVSYSLKVFYCPSEVDSSHRFYENVEYRTFTTRRQHQFFFTVAAVKFTDIFAIDEDLGEVTPKLIGCCGV